MRESVKMKHRVILIRPDDPRNVGAVVRVAVNFDAAAVRLVGARRWGADEERRARIASAGA
ncbi:MAG: TrmH family RNA methyltransferase, partial [bacterium]